MASELALQTTKSEIQSFATSPKVPDFINLSALDDEMFYMPVVKRSQESALRTAAASHHAALRPASHAEREAILGELRLRAIPRTEGADEARARHRKLIEDVADLPADILRQACDDYVNSDGKRFYPTAGEIRAFAGPLLARRLSRRSRLAQMADAAANAFEDADRCSPEAAAEIMKRYNIASLGVGQ